MGPGYCHLYLPLLIPESPYFVSHLHSPTTPNFEERTKKGMMTKQEQPGPALNKRGGFVYVEHTGDGPTKGMKMYSQKLSG